jgi:hypothetical protein
MKYHSTTPHRVLLCASTMAAVILSACAGSGSPVALTTASAAKSWMNPAGTKVSNLLYISNASNVTVYSYSKGSDVTQVGTLTGFASPQGMCADQAGDVWIADYDSRTMFEYAHGATAPMTKITAKTGFPYACAIDNATGNLAVSYWHPNGHFRNYGDVVVYAPGAQTGKSYGPYTGFYRSYFLAYDDNSNLFTNGFECGYSECYRSQRYIPLYELPAGASQFVRLKGGKQQRNISALVWVNPSLLMGTGTSGSKAASAVKLQITAGRAKSVGKVLFDQTFLTYGFTVRAGLVVVPDFAGNIVRIYNLSDGSLVSSFTQGLSQPFDAVISQTK